jgi:hypothetical protein
MVESRLLAVAPWLLCSQVKMSSLDRKLFRDLAKLKGQSIAACLVMACGLAMMIMTRSLVVVARIGAVFLLSRVSLWGHLLRTEACTKRATRTSGGNFRRRRCGNSGRRHTKTSFV